MKNTLIMLDLDGTLIDTSRLYLQGFPQVVQKHTGMRITREDILARWGRFARDCLDHFARQAGMGDSRLVDRMYEEFCVFYNQQHNRLSRPYPHVCACLPRLRKAGFRVGVVTTRPSNRSKPVLQMDWAAEVAFFVWSDQVTRHKPFPDGIDLAMETYADGHRQGIYAGDNRHDIEAAHASRYRITSVAALWGAMDRQRLLGAKPHRAFETFEDFARWLLSSID